MIPYIGKPNDHTGSTYTQTVMVDNDHITARMLVYWYFTACQNQIARKFETCWLIEKQSGQVYIV